MEHDEFMRQFEAEARRLRLNMYRLSAFASSGTGWENEVLERMRGLEPGASWEDVIPGLELPAPDPMIADLVASFDPDVYWREREISDALSRELHRVVLSDPALASADGIGFNFPHGKEHALRVLRRLPDNAGWRAYHDALASTPPDE